MTTIASPHPDVELPTQTLTTFVLEHAERLGDKPALIDGATGTVLSYAQLAADVRSTAAGLAARGLGKGDVLALHAPNSPEWAVVFHAVATLGAITTTVNPAYGPEEVTHQLHDAGARFLVTSAAVLETAVKAAEGTPVEKLIVIGGGDGAHEALAEVTACTDEPPAVDIGPDDLVVLPYSSGTTGLPKGVKLSHHNLVANIAQINPHLKVGESSVAMAVLPFFHIYGMVVILNATLRQGGSLVTMPRFDLPGFLGLIAEHKVTHCFVVPPVALALAKHPLVDEHDTSSIEVVMCGAAPLGPELSDACSARIGCAVVQGYGMTEASPVTHMETVGGENRPGTIGRAVANTETRLVDPESGSDVEQGQPGEVWVRGPQVMQGYLNNDAATAETVDADGWLHTGDIGVVDADGWFTIVDRLKELIKVKAFQVAPAELEALLLEHPQIADAAVIGIPDEESGELPRAFVVTSGDVSEDEIKEFVKGRVATYKRLHDVVFVEEIPKSASGKILRRVLRDR